MEHLVYIPKGPQGTVAAFNAKILSTEWAQETDVIPFQSPLTPWLGFDHENRAIELNLRNYPTQRGWNYDDIWQGNLRSSHRSLAGLDKIHVARKVVAMLQSWFYFGLLECVVNKPIAVSYFVRRNIDGLPCIYSRNLHFCLQAWIFQIRLQPAAQQEAASLRILNALHLVSHWIQRMCVYADPNQKRFHAEMEASYPGFGNAVTLIVPSIIRLGEAVDCARLTVSGKLPSDISWHYPLSALSSQLEILKQRGWCPYTLRVVIACTGTSTLDWLTTLTAWPGTDSHEHEICTEYECKRNNIAWDTYEVAHRPDCPRENCNFLKPPLWETLEILKNGHVPVINFDNDGTLKVSPRFTTQPGDYTAFSHVWVDGIGSSTEDGLPSCQLAFLRDVTCDVTKSSDPAFWIDSLCVPKRRSARRKAIIAMHATYLNASRVVVLDKNIQKHRSDVPSEILFCAIYTSGWMQRLWTYQEALLARRLIFKVANGVYELDALDVQKNRPPSIPNSICHVYRALGAQLLRLRGKSESTRNIASVSRDLGWRCTARYTDETLAIAGVLGIDVALLLVDVEQDTSEVDDDSERIEWSELCQDCKTALEHENLALQHRRMVAALQATFKLPRDIIFLQGRKLPVENFRWAPLTLMSRSTLRVNHLRQNAECTSAGLTGYWWLLALKRIRQGDNKAVRYVGSISEKSVYRVFFKEAWPAPPAAWDYGAIVLYGEETGSLVEGQTVQGLAVIKVSLGEATAIYRTVGSVLVEKLRFKEAFSEGSSMMFSPPPEGIAEASLSWQLITIT
ncbi:hypothetical protein BP6252_13841 [Coleophoma cylindrospora]|uniref:Heterokaryon incompatibility domain-containing protein n=1 Tax=Coleophoma cylindrospora TaxID=1849047 RepID=A0A3D8Q5H5_9HELO|nr:hypothetical protein BP6252_13841 [Coleophoma cylindrospora]